ncbi:CIA30 family protein [Muriicola soli]|uniref:CIA30 family protein n=1 Tax=Muriicola soli TaxID=2507538 RepID=A0A411E7P3_9FLAO|nr:CIA30 family protein [Muriicola soli]QBA63745.1 CIA30 family protein [Muriicola soli]
MGQASFTLFQFSDSSDISKWQVVNDGVMGGLSKGRISLNEEGKGVFQGFVSLENNGGFSLVQYSFKPKAVSDFTSLEIKLKGDGKKYQIRVKSSSSQYYNYAYTFETTGKWQTLSIPFKAFIPQFRGRQLNMPPYPGQEMGEVAILIGNKKAEEFRIELDHILLK